MPGENGTRKSSAPGRQRSCRRIVVRAGVPSHIAHRLVRDFFVRHSTILAIALMQDSDNMFDGKVDVHSDSKVIFVNRFFFPDHSATSQILSDLAFHLAKTDCRVCVIASRQLYDDPEALLPRREVVGNVEIVRVTTTRFGRQNLAGRSIDYLSFYVTAAFALFSICHRGDYVVAKTDPPLISVICMVVARLKRAHLINWLQDLFPEVAIRLGVGLRAGIIANILTAIRDLSLRAAKRNVAIGTAMQRVVLQRGVPIDRVCVIWNWADDESLTPIERDANPLRAEWGLTGKFVVSYSGNLGRAHDVNTIVAAAELLQSESDVVFLIIGGGSQFQKMQDLVALRGVSNVVFKPYQPRSNLSASLGVADLHIVMLQENLEGLIVPSKFYGAAAAGRAIAFLGSNEGEIARAISENRCGAVFGIGDYTGLSEYIRHLSFSPQEVAGLGVNARKAIDIKYSKNCAFNSWSAMLKSLRSE